MADIKMEEKLCNKKMGGGGGGINFIVSLLTCGCFICTKLIARYCCN